MVVWAHADGPYSNFITAFHMPLFFFASGILFKTPSNFYEYVKKKAKSLLVPFWCWNLILLVPFWVIYYWKNWSVKVLLKLLLTICLTLDKVPMLGATWFLPALFWSSCVFALMHRELKFNKIVNDIMLFVCGCIAFTVGIKITFPYRISRVLICSLFFIIGYLYNEYSKRYVKNCVISLNYSRANKNAQNYKPLFQFFLNQSNYP